jgi:LysM repeat protein
MHRQKFFFGALALGAWLCTNASAAPQDNAATAAAEREEMEANYKRMHVKLEQLEEAFRSQQKHFTDLAGEISSLRSEVDRLKNKNESAATQDSIKVLKEKIEEVDRKRRADSEQVAKTLSGFAKDLTKTPLAPAPKDPGPAPVPKEPGAGPRGDKAPKESPGGPPEKSYEYKIKSGDTLARIVTELRAQNWKVTQKQVIDANPGVKWERLKIGQTIFIPSPPPSP